MNKFLLITSISIFLSIANAESLKNFQGHWGFNRDVGKKAKCLEVSEKLLKQSEKSNVKCKGKPSQRSFDQAGGKWFQCEGSKFSWNVYETETICNSNLKAMLMNAD